MKKIKNILACLMVVAAAALIIPTTVYADTNGKEIQLTDQPDKLILQLGPQWAGVEFELKTDAGIFPVPVVVDSTGVLKMDLGGSKTYTLSCLSSGVTVPGPDQTEDIPASTPPPEPTPPADTTDAPAPSEAKDGVPTGLLIMFILGLVAAVGGLLAMKYFKRRRETYYDDDEDDYE